MEAEDHVTLGILNRAGDLAAAWHTHPKALQSLDLASDPVRLLLGGWQVERFRDHPLCSGITLLHQEAPLREVVDFGLRFLIRHLAHNSGHGHGIPKAGSYGVYRTRGYVQR